LTAPGGIVPPAMRVVRPVPPLHRHRRRSRPGEDRFFILRSDLGATVLRMISTQSLSAFTPAAVDRGAPAQPPRDAVPAKPVEVAAAPAQRALEAVPAQPARPMPRGSLLDLRV
jgi:hypothetical protein